MNNFSRFYSKLNDAQRSAVDTTDGALLILAGPGTGKTQLLSLRAGAILAKGKAAPENILILTYTNSAAKAMKERLARIIGGAGYEVEISTFHGFANSIILTSAEAANYVANRIQMTDVERTRAIEYILNNTHGLDDIRPFRAPYTYLGEILRKISDLKQDGITPEKLENYLNDKKNLYRSMDEKHVKRLKALSIVYRRYEELKVGKDNKIFDERGRYDFDDMILFATRALREEESLKKDCQDQYRYIMIDEYQDTNGAQLELLLTFLDYELANICCVGDDDQSIYRFQGASVGNFKLLSQRFPNIVTISLKDNYRSSDELIDVSKKIIGLIPSKERMAEKTLRAVRKYPEQEISFREFTTETEELLYIVDKVRELKMTIEKDRSLPDEERLNPYNNIAVLVRKRAHILKVIDAFLQAGIPYATDGKEDISGEIRVKQLMDILELAYADPLEHELRDSSLYKVLTSDYMRISHSDILRFISFVNAKRKAALGEKTTMLAEFLSYFSSRGGKMKLESEDKLRIAARAVLQLVNDAGTKPVHKILIDYIKDTGLYRFILKEYNDNSILRIRELRALTSFVNMVKASDIATPAIRLDGLMKEFKTRKEHGLAIQGNLVTLTQTGVRIYTAHGSKGMEFHSVIIPFCLQNRNWPARRIPEKILMPPDLFKAKNVSPDKDSLKQLALQDETRLFYVAVTRAKSHLVFTASPTEDRISSYYLNRLGIEKAKGAEQEESIARKSLEMTGLRDPFVGTGAVLKDMIANLTLNPTRLNNYMTCPRKFLYNDILKLPGPKKKTLVFGNCVHKALEDTFRLYMEKRAFPTFRFFREAFERELIFQGVDESIARDCRNSIPKLKNWFDHASKNPVLPLGLERKLLVTIGDNIIFTGKYDKVEWHDENKALVRILDYKTGKPDDHLKAIDKCDDLASPDCDPYLRQLVCYKLLFEKDKKESRGKRVTGGVLAFVSEPVSVDMRKIGYKKGDYVSKYVEISDEMVSDIEKIIKDVWHNINRLRFDKFKERDEKLCARCDFDDICWR